MKKSFIVLGLASILVVSGCGKNKDKVEDDFSAIGTTDDSITTENEDKFIPEHEKSNIVGTAGNWTINIDADVDADIYNSAAVYSVNNIEIDEDYIKEYAASLFDNGEYKIEVPYYLLSKEELSDIIESYGTLEQKTAEQDENGVYYVSQAAIHANEAKQTTDGTQVASYQEGKVFYEYNDVYRMKEFDPANRIWREYGDKIEDQISFARISGNIDGVPCELSVKKYSAFDETRIWIYTTENSSSCHSTMLFDKNDQQSIENNYCNYDEAEKTAYAMAKKIAGDDYALCNVYTRMVVGSNSVLSDYNGYVFYFSPLVEGEVMAYNSNYSVMDSLDAYQNGIYVNQPILSISVDTKGFSDAKFLSMAEVEQCLSNSPELLSYNQIMDQLPIYAEELLKDVKNYQIDINRIVLSYVEVKQKDGYAVVPAWLFYVSNAGYVEMKEAADFGINALDGSLIIYGLAIDDYFNILGQR